MDLAYIFVKKISTFLTIYNALFFLRKGSSKKLSSNTAMIQSLPRPSSSPTLSGGAMATQTAARAEGMLKLS